MSWHRHARRAGRHLWRLVLLSLVLVLVLAGAVLAVLGSETGSRWLLEQGVGMQRTVSARYQSGTLLGGLELADVRARTAKTDVRIRHLLARWSVWSLLRGTIEVDSLRLRGVQVRRLVAPSADPVVLPTLILPLRLVVRDASVEDVSFWRWQAASPLTLRRMVLEDARWRGSRLRFRHLGLDQERIGQLDLAGTIRLRGGYPLEMTGRLDALPLREKGVAPAALRLAGSVEGLQLWLTSTGRIPLRVEGRVSPLEPRLPFEAYLTWQAFRLPFWSDQEWASEGGSLKVRGDREGLAGQGEAKLSSRALPSGTYEVDGRSDWHSASIKTFKFIGLGGKVKASGTVDWRAGLAWDLVSRLDTVDLSRKWSVPHQVVPVLTGDLKSIGRTKTGDAAITLSLRLANGETWDLLQKGRSAPWHLDDPQQLRLRWSGVQRVLPDGQRLQSASGELRVDGSRSGYHASGALQLGGSRLPEGDWLLDVDGAGQKVAIRQLAYQGVAGNLGVTGELELVAPATRWRGALDLSGFDTNWLLPAWPGRLTGQVTGSGEWGPGRRVFDLGEVHLQGPLRERPLVADGSLYLRLPPGAWPEARTEALVLGWGDNQATLAGGLRDGRWDLAAQFDLAEPALLRPDLQGRLQGLVGVQGDRLRPDVQATVAGDGAGAAGWTLRGATLEARLDRLGEGDSQIRLLLDGVTNPAKKVYGGVALDLAGTREHHRLDWRGDGERISAQGVLAGGLVAGGWKGVLESGQVNLADLGWMLAEPVAIDWESSRRQLRLAAHCWTSQDAKLCSPDEMRIGPEGHVRVALEGLSLERLGGLMPEGLQASGRLEGRAAGDWEAGQRPLVQAALASSSGQVRLLREDGRSSLVLGYDRIGLEADAGLKSVELRFDLQSPDMGQGRAQARIDPFAAGKPLAGTLSLQGLRLEVLQPFFPALSTLAGTVSADGRLEGVLARPEFHGALQLRDGELGFQRLPLHVTDVATRVEINGTNAIVRGSLRSGPGGATLDGKADWAGEPWLEMGLKGSRFQLSQPPELQAEIDPDLRLRVVPRRADLTGTIRIPTAQLILKPLTDKAVPLSPDIRVARRGDRLQAVEQAAGWDINADIRLLLGDDVFFHGYGVNGRVMGGLRLRQEGRRGLEANGEVELDKDARYDAYGQRLQIRRGRLIFAGNLTQPGLDVEAIREIDNKVVGVRMEGRANAPEAELFSDTPMAQEEIISYLVLGRPLENNTGSATGGSSNLAAAAAAIKLGATGSAGLTNRFGETLGITDLALDAEGDGDDTQVVVSGYISPKLYLRYGVGIFTPVNTATLRYKINSRLYLEAVTSLESAIDLFYNFRF